MPPGLDAAPLRESGDVPVFEQSVSTPTARIASSAGQRVREFIWRVFPPPVYAGTAVNQYPARL